MATDERTELLALLRTLTPAQWQAPSLCADWSVRDVATHVVSYDELSKTALVGTFLRGGGVAKVNAVALRRYAGLDADSVMDLLARNLRPRGLAAGFRGGIALTDGTIHHQDIRRALGLPRTIPAARLVSVLDFALGAPTLPAKKNAKGLRLRANDVDWTSGVGLDVSGPGEALLMALAGRPHSLDELSGSGMPTLRTRVERPDGPTAAPRARLT
jgi:uncharacterized protein (TIGR03083 family)